MIISISISFSWASSGSSTKRWVARQQVGQQLPACRCLLTSNWFAWCGQNFRQNDHLSAPNTTKVHYSHLDREEDNKAQFSFSCVLLLIVGLFFCRPENWCWCFVTINGTIRSGLSQWTSNYNKLLLLAAINFQQPPTHTKPKALCGPQLRPIRAAIGRPLRPILVSTCQALAAVWVELANLATVTWPARRLRPSSSIKWLLLFQFEAANWKLAKQTNVCVSLINSLNSSAR